MEARMTVCNMTIEWGAKAGLIAPDQTTFDYIEGRAEAPKGADWDAAVEHWQTPAHRRRRGVRRGDRARRGDDDAVRHVGHQPRPGRAAGRLACRSPRTSTTRATEIAAEKALEYMGLEAGTPMREIKVDTVFVGSCTNGRIEDLRAAAEIIEGRTVAEDTRLLVVPGSVRVRLQAEEEGLDVVFKEAGGEWRGAGCSMCLGMNPDQLAPRERSASTSNRNFEGRQGKGGRTHLVSVPVAAATAIRGTLSSPADLPPLATGRDRGGLTWRSSPATPASASRCDAATSTPTRSSRPSTSSGSPAPASRTGCSRPGATTRLRPQQGGVRRGLGAGRRTRLRHRLVARARRVGPAELRVQGRDLATLRRHLPRQLRQGRTGRRPGRREGRPAAVGPPRGRARHRRSPSTSSRAPCGPATGPDAIEDSFDIDDYTRWRLLEGLDDIGITLSHDDDIAAYEADRPSWKPATL